MRPLRAVIVKEFAHILRDPASLTIVLLMPLLMMFIFGYAINYDLDQVEVGLIDLSGSRLARDLVGQFRDSQTFRVRDLRALPGDPLARGEAMLREGTVKEIIIIPADLARRAASRGSGEIGIVIDGSDANVANLVYQYNQQILAGYNARARGLGQRLKIDTKVYFNPEMRSAVFFIPGLIAILLVMISALLTSLSIAREQESGSIDLLFISPLKSAEIIVGKTIPYILVAFIDEMIILLFAALYFDIPFKGGLPVLFLFSFLYIVTGLSLGILVSTAATSQKAAMFAALLITLLPSVMLSGFIFPLESMGPVLRGLSHLVPASYFLEIIRGVVVKGAGFRHFIPQGLALLIFSLVLLAGATLKFKKRRERSS
jgi:ABC-2 type transport system permease protein